jgi:signal peptidase I
VSTVEEQPEPKPELEQPVQVMASQPPGGQQAASRPTPRKERGWLAGSVQSLAGTVAIALFVITFVVQAFQIPSESMENTLLIGDYLLVDKVHFGEGGVWGHLLPYAAIRRGDIIVFRYPVKPVQHFVKRVIAVPGDTVRLINKQVYVNGKPLTEKYALYRSSLHDVYRDDFPRTDYIVPQVESSWWVQMRGLVHGGELRVPPEEYFVMGDNRDESLDSRYWGFVPRENIIGRPLLIYWSVRSGERPTSAGAADDKLHELAYAVTRIFQDTRWNRTFRLVR